MSDHSSENLYAVVAEYDTPDSLRKAARTVRDAGYKKTDAFVPFPMEGLDEDLGMESTRMGWVVLLMGLVGGITGFFMQYWANVDFYAINIGGKPMNSWPNFIVITFEFTIIFAAFAAGLFMLGRNGLPKYHNSIFNTPNFQGTRDKFYIAVEAKDPKFNSAEVMQLLQGTEAAHVYEVEV